MRIIEIPMPRVVMVKCDPKVIAHVRQVFKTNTAKQQERLIYPWVAESWCEMAKPANPPWNSPPKQVLLILVSPFLQSKGVDQL